MQVQPQRTTAGISATSVAKPATVTVQYAGNHQQQQQRQANGSHKQQIITLPARTIPGLTPTSSILNAQARNQMKTTLVGTVGNHGGTRVNTQGLQQGQIVNLGGPTIRMAIKSGPGVPAIVHTPSGSRRITVPLQTPSSNQLLKTQMHTLTTRHPINTGNFSGVSRAGTPPLSKPTIQFSVANKPMHLARTNTAPGALSSLVKDNSIDKMNGFKNSMINLNDITTRRAQSPVPVQVS